MKKKTGNREKYVTIPVRRIWCYWCRNTHACVNMQDRSSASVSWYGHIHILLMGLCLWSVSAFPILVVKYLKYYSCVYVLENTPQHTVSIFGWVLEISAFFLHIFSHVLFIFLQFAYINFTVRINNKNIFILQKIITDLPKQKTIFFPPEKSFWYW